jgi:hypothetical protein
MMAASAQEDAARADNRRTAIETADIRCVRDQVECADELVEEQIRGREAILAPPVIDRAI